MILGNPRSGTSLLGKLIGSCKNCEYSFEPELLPYLLNIYNDLTKDKWKQIFEGYIEEELFFNLLLGRKINFRKYEDSSIDILKSKNEISNKLSLKLSRLNLDQYLKKIKLSLL